MATVVSFQDNPVFFYVANAVVLCIAAILCNAVVGGGIIALFKGKSDNDTLPSLGVVAALIQSACLIFAPEDTAYGAVLFTPVVILGLVFNSIGKLHIVGRIERNFNSLSAPGDKHAVLLLKDRDMSRSMLGGLDVSNPKVCYGCKAGSSPISWTCPTVRTCPTRSAVFWACGGVDSLSGSGSRLVVFP